VPVAVLVAATWIAFRRRALGDALGLATVASLLTSPITWYFYLTLALLPLARWWPRSPDGVCAPATFWPLSRAWPAQRVAGATCRVRRSGAGAGILMEPALALVLLGILLAWLSRESLV